MVVIDMPLLFETGFYRVTRPNILVACSEDMQLMRLAARDGLGREAAEARIRAQMPLEQKATLANIIVNNDGSVEELRRQAEDVVQRLKRGSWLHLSLFSPAGALLLIFGAWRWLQ